MSPRSQGVPTVRRPLPELLAMVAAAVVGVLLLATYAVLADLVVWGHDEVHYYADFGFKLVEDGRWINQLLHDVLRSQPPGTWALAWFVGWIVLFHRAARDLGLPDPESLMFAGIVLLTFPFAEQVLWPATSFPALAALLLLQVASRRGLPVPAICLLGGVAIFGSMQSFYFLLPLLFLDTLFDAGASKTQRWQRFLVAMAWWIAGAVAGVLSMSIAVWLLAGQFGVEPAAWRQTQPIEQPGDVLRNLQHVAGGLVVFARTLWTSLGLANLAFAALVVATVLARVRRLPSASPGIAMLAAIALGFFAISVPLAPVLHGRSVVALSAALVLALLLLPGHSGAGRVVGSVLAVGLAWHAAMVAGRSLQEHHAETRFVRAKLEAVLPARPAAFSGIALHGALPSSDPLARLFNEPPHMHGLIHAAGARGYRDCRTGLDPRCDTYALPVATSTVAFGSGELWYGPGPGGLAVVGWRPITAAPREDGDPRTP